MDSGHCIVCGNELTLKLSVLIGNTHAHCQFLFFPPPFVWVYLAFGFWETPSVPQGLPWRGSLESFLVGLRGPFRVPRIESGLPVPCLSHTLLPLISIFDGSRNPVPPGPAVTVTQGMEEFPFVSKPFVHLSLPPRPHLSRPGLCLLPTRTCCFVSCVCFLASWTGSSSPCSPPWLGVVDEKGLTYTGILWPKREPKSSEIGAFLFVWGTPGCVQDLPLC